MSEDIPRKANNPAKREAGTVSLRCPDCRQNGTFEPITGISDLHLSRTQRRIDVGGHPKYDGVDWLFGQRRCPDPNCQAHVFVVLEGNNKVATSYPAERIDFDHVGIPERIVRTLEEAITCYAEQCYTAAAIMVRRTLEELCEDRKATGDNLRKRIRKLKDSVVISEGLIEGMGNLILLGNDAAHVESRTFEQVDREEVQLGIEITKEILKAVYQEKNLVERLNKLKRNSQ